MKLGEKFAKLMNSQGVKVHSSIALGKWLHVDTNKDQEMNIRHAMFTMGAKEVKTLSAGADGKHLDGSRHHRIVAIF